MSEIIKMEEALKRLSVSKPEEFLWRLPEYLSVVAWANKPTFYNQSILKKLLKSKNNSPMEINEKNVKEAFEYARQFDSEEKVDRLTIIQAYLAGCASKLTVNVGDLANGEVSKCPKHDEAYLAYEYNENEVVEGIRVTGMGESFMIARSDAENGKQFAWDEAKKKFKLPTKKQATLMCAVLDEINHMLGLIGGDKLAGGYWTSDEYNGIYAWFFNGHNGRLDNAYKLDSFSVRIVLD